MDSKKCDECEQESLFINCHGRRTEEEREREVMKKVNGESPERMTVEVSGDNEMERERRATDFPISDENDETKKKKKKIP